MTIVPMPFSALASVGCWGTSRAPLKFAGFGLERYLTIFLEKLGFWWKTMGFFASKTWVEAARHGVWANLEFANRNATVYLQETNGFQHKETKKFQPYDMIGSNQHEQFKSLIQTPWGSRSCHQKRFRVCGEMLPVLLFVVKPKGDPSLQLTGTNHLIVGRGMGW